MKKLLQSKQKQVINYMTRKEVNLVIPTVGFPSVSKVLSNGEPNHIRELMRKNPNSERAQAIKRGVRTHRALETGEAKNELEAAVLDIFSHSVLIDFDEVWGSEEFLAHPLRYRGKFDGVGIYLGKLTLFDYKKSNKRYSPAQMKKHLPQLVAYKQAHEWLYSDHKIEQVALFNLFGKTPTEVGALAHVYENQAIEEATFDFNKRF